MAGACQRSAAASFQRVTKRNLNATASSAAYIVPGGGDDK